MAHTIAINANRLRVPSHHRRETQRAPPERRNSQENRHQSAIADSRAQQKMVRRMRQNARRNTSDGYVGCLSSVWAINGTWAWASGRYARKRGHVLHNCYPNKRLRRKLAIAAEVQLPKHIPAPTLGMSQSSTVRVIQVTNIETYLRF
jgi:hypothetical protein